MYSINTAQIADGDRRSAGRVVSAARRRSARRTRRDRLPHLDAGPFLSYGIQWIAFGIIAPIGVGYFVVRRDQGSADARRPQPTRRPHAGSPDHHRGEARRPLRQAALTVTAPAPRPPAERPATAAPTGARSSTSRSRPVAQRRPDLELGARTASAHRAARPARRRTTPRRRPRSGWDDGRRRDATPRTASRGRPADDGCADRHQNARHPGGEIVQRRRRIALRPNRIGHSAATGGRSSRRGCWRRGRPAAPGTPPTAPHSSGATCASEVFSATDSSAARASPRRPATAGSRPHSDGSRRRAPSTSSRVQTDRPCRRRCGPATCRPARRTSPRPSIAADPARPRRAAARSTRDPRAAERAEQHTGVRDAGDPVVGVGEPFQAARRRAEQRHRMTAPRVAEQPGRPGSRQRGRPPGRGRHRRKHPGSVSQGGVLECMRLGPPRRPTRVVDLLNPAAVLAPCGERDHAVVLARRRLRRAGEPGGQRQRLQASVQAGPHHRHLSRRGDARHRCRSRADPRRGRQGARAGAIRRSQARCPTTRSIRGCSCGWRPASIATTSTCTSILYGPLDDESADAIYSGRQRSWAPPCRSVRTCGRQTESPSTSSGSDRSTNCASTRPVREHLHGVAALAFLPAPLRLLAGRFNLFATTGFLPPSSART